MSLSALALFTGMQTAKVDAKNRVATPADFRRILTEQKKCLGFHATPNLQNPEFLDCGGDDFVLDLQMQLDEMGPYDEDRLVLDELLIGRMKWLPFDADGRVVLPAPLREKASIKDSVLFFGKGATFQICDGAVGEARMKNLENRGPQASLRLKPIGAIRRGGGA